MPRDQPDVIRGLLAADGWIRADEHQLWLVARALDVTNALCDPFLSSRVPASGAHEGPSAELQVVRLDALDHARVRNALRPAFGHRALHSHLRDLDAVVAAVVRAAPVQAPDLVGSVSRPVARSVMAWMLAGNVAKGLRLLERVEEEMLQLPLVVPPIIDEWLSGKVSGPIRHRARADDVSREELHANLILLVGAGIETTGNLISSALEEVIRYGATPVRAIDTALRCQAPVQVVERVASHDYIAPQGHQMRAGDRVLVHLGAASFESEGPRLAFGHGKHYCLGAGLAEMIASLTIKAADMRWGLRRGHIVDARWAEAAAFRGLDELVVRFPGAAG